MAGEAHLELVTAYLGRLTGEQPSAETPLVLRSVHRAALASWARKQNVPVRLAIISAGTPFTVRDLLGDGDLPATVAAPQAKSAAAMVGVGATVGAVGIDIEEVENLPEAHDYREHPFFQDNFTPAEIAHCIRQMDVRASFCGTWAAKEAVLKSGVGTAPNGALKTIEITRDDAGRPIYPGCQLSISHTPKTAVAMCVAAAPAPTSVVAAVIEQAPPQEPAPPAARSRWPWSRSQ